MPLGISRSSQFLLIRSYHSRSCDKPSFVHLRSDLFPNILQQIEGDRRIPRVPVVGLANVRARNDRLLASKGGIQGPHTEADATRLQPAGLRSSRGRSERPLVDELRQRHRRELIAPFIFPIVCFLRENLSADKPLVPLDINHRAKL
jgi:hypothetical protein